MSLSRIAQIAGVSDATVSRVLNNKPGPSTETAQTVSMIAREIGYTHKKNRQKMKSSSFAKGARSDMFAFLAFGISNHVTLLSVIEGIESVLTKQHLNLNVNFITEEKSIPKMVLNGYVDGIFLFGRPNLSEALMTRLKKIPTIWLLYNYGGWGSHFTPDNPAIGRKAAEYVISRDYKKIAVLMASKPSDVAPYGERARGFVEHIKSSGFSTDVYCSERETAILGIDDALYSVMISEEISKLLDKMLADSVCPDVIFVPSDREVAELYQQLAIRGVKIGVETQIVTCDGHNHPLIHPMPTVVDIRADLVGRYAAEHMLMRLDNLGDVGEIKTLVQPRLNGL